MTSLISVISKLSMILMIPLAIFGLDNNINHANDDYEPKIKQLIQDGGEAFLTLYYV